MLIPVSALAGEPRHPPRVHLRRDVIHPWLAAVRPVPYERAGRLRVLQGIGGAMMMPVCTVGAAARLPAQRTAAGAELRPARLVGPILGPLLGGWLVTYGSWIF